MDDGVNAGAALADDNLVDDNLLEVVARKRNELRRSDGRVAEAVLAAPGEVLDMTLAQLAARAGVSEPTVLRFCAAIGCDGFRDMRVKLARSLAFARATSHSAIEPSDDLATLTAKIFDFNLSNLTWVRSRLDQTALQAAVNAIVPATRLEFFGFGASAIVAQDAQQKFPLFGVPCGAPADGHQMYMAASMMTDGAVAVGISNTGTTREVIDSLRIAKANGATTLAIAGQAGSPLALSCDIALVADSLENTDRATPTVSRMSALVIVDILSTAVSFARSEDHRRRLAAMKSGLAQRRGASTDPLP